MPIITKITRQKKNQERYNIFLDETYAFSVDEEILARFQLTKNMELSEFDIGEIGYEDEVRKAFNRSLVFLSYRMRSEHEIAVYLKEQEYGESVIEEALHKLRQYGYVNDREFTKAYINTKLRTSDKGARQLSNGLREKGIAQPIIEEMVHVVEEQEWIERGQEIAEKVVKKNSRQSEIQVKNKVQETLSRKGYSGAVIKEVLNRLVIERDEEEALFAVMTQARKAHSKFASKYDGYEYKQRMKQALFRKGFAMDEIEQAIERVQEEE